MSSPREEEAKTPGWLVTKLKQLIFLPSGLNPLQGPAPDCSNPASFKPSASELVNSSSFFISSLVDDKSSKIGAWYFHPEKFSGKVEKLTKDDTVVLYLHGNDSHRGDGMRLNLYTFLLKLGYHVLAIDYRGFGDSSPVDLSESTVVSDARTALSWIVQELGDKAKIVVWGHSLGSGVACHMVAEAEQDSLTSDSSPVSGVVLEAPFNSMYNEVMTFKAAQALARLTDIKDMMEQGDILFHSERWLPTIKCPVLMFHAQDDNVVPFHLGQALYETACLAGKTNIRFVSYPASARLGHCGLCLPGKTAREVETLIESIDRQNL